MAKKYYNIKIGSPDVNGGVISVDTSRQPSSRLEDYAGVYIAGSMQFKHLDKEGIRYQLTKPEIKIVNDHLAEGSAAVPTGRKISVQLTLGSDGELSVSKKPVKTQVYLKKISPQKAKSMREEEVLWAAQLDYICG